jgi:phosphoribosylformimino-5-aminoimidazole carboxamide ribonucleotide (ProFAR) isomerase
MSESEKISGVKAYLRRTKSTAELEDLADACYAEATETVTITSISSEGTSSSGQVSFPKYVLLQAIEDLLAEGGGGRQIGDVLVRSQFHSPV